MDYIWAFVKGFWKTMLVIFTVLVIVGIVETVCSSGQTHAVCPQYVYPVTCYQVH